MKLFDRLVVLSLPLAPKKVVGWVASRYVSGASVADAVAAVRKLNEQGAVATVDILGESVSVREKAEKVVKPPSTPIKSKLINGTRVHRDCACETPFTSLPVFCRPDIARPFSVWR